MTLRRARVVPAIDVDGVVADFAVHACGKLDLDINALKTCTFADSFGPEVGALLEELIELPETWVQLKPFPDAPKQIARLTERTPQGYIPFIFLSAVPAEFYLLRQWWLWYHLDRHHDINETAWQLIASHRKDKPQDCLGWGVTHLLEDNPHTAASCQALGMRAYVLPRPYNEGTEPDVPRATLEEFVDVVLTDASQVLKPAPRKRTAHDLDCLATWENSSIAAVQHPFAHSEQEKCTCGFWDEHQKGGDVV